MSAAPENDRWFVEEVHPHRAVLRAWLQGRYPDAADIDNLVQEAMTRVWRARTEGGRPIGSPRALLFTTARNLAIDQLRRQQRENLEPITELAEKSVFEEAPTPADSTARTQELELLTQAIQSLPDRCRQVLTLRKIYGLPQKEIAARLGITENTVEVQVANGVRRCAEFLTRAGVL
jgi:RNA polymerase sigma-70 factor (ECF subfamily)